MSPAVATPSPRPITREDVIARGRAGKPWEFLALAVQAAAQWPLDTGVRFLLAANLAQLGLRTLAGEALDALPEGARGDADVRALADALEQLPDDRVPVAHRRATALANLRVLRGRGLDGAGLLSAAFEAWSAGSGHDDCFRTADGNLVRRLRRGGGVDWTRFLIDQRGAAARFCAQLGATLDLVPPPMAVEGIDPPWLFAAVHGLLGRNRMGYSAAITVLQADPLEFFDGLSAADLGGALADPRVRVFVGADASQRWINDALARVDETALGVCVATPGVRGRIAPPAQAATGRVAAAQTEEFRRLQARVAALYTGRDARWWERRYREAAQGGPPLRVLVPTSRYSTYIRHAAADLAAAFEALGCEARVVMEPSNHSKPSAVGHLRPIAEFEPDLVALINYFRGDAGLPYPAELPWLCWIQDAMPHQYAERSWGGLDFVAGHVPVELWRRDGFPSSRSLPFPVVASTRKFHAGPVGAGLAERFACEVAYVSHQSETPGVFHERCKAESGDAGSARILDALRPVVEREAGDPMRGSLADRLRLACPALLENLGATGDAGYLFRHYAMPLADKVIRHEMLRWAASVCERRGWRLRVFGRGWESHPELALHARGELAHGDELRACYQGAAVHLHASATVLVHQRVMECALSGGLPLGRLTFDAVSESTGWAKREALLHAEPCGRDERGWVGYRTADCPALAEIGAIRRELGEEFPEVLRLSPAQEASFARPDHHASQGLHPAWLFGGLREQMFRSEAELEGLLGRAVGDPAWRAGRSAAMAARVRDRCSAEVFAAKVLEMVRGSLAAGAVSEE